MKKKLNFRQFASVFIIMNLSLIFKIAPNILEITMFAVLSFLILAILSYILNKFKNQNLYEILVNIFGKFFSKIIVLIIICPIIYMIYLRLNDYIINLNLTLIPYTKSYILIFTIVFLIIYGLIKGSKSIFIMSDLILMPILFIIFIFFILSVPNINVKNLIAYNNINKDIGINYYKELFIIIINFITVLFIGDKLKKDISYFKEASKYQFIVIILIIVTSIVSVGICGQHLVAKVRFPFYTGLKSISAFGYFERMEVLITLISFFSDYISLYFYTLLIIYCIKWIFLSYDKL